MLLTGEGGSSNGAGGAGGGGNSGWKLVLASVPFGAAHLGGELVTELEGRNVGVTWTTAYQRGGGHPSFVDLCTMLVVSILVWSLVGAYLEQVLKDPEYGERRSVCFCAEDLAACCCRRNWGERQSRRKSSNLRSPLLNEDDDDDDDDDAAEENDPHHEAVVMDADTLVIVRRLTKTYKGNVCSPASNTKLAVHGLSFSLQRNQIFCLLGHNGAGKTSTIKAMTNGSFDNGRIRYHLPSSERGSSSNNNNNNQRVQSYDMSSPSDRKHIQSHIGLCPQHDVLWNECTPNEHVRFFARLKGMNDDDIVEEEVKRLVAQIRLPAGDENRPVGEFSGGNRRKVSLATAMVGNPSVVYLDEPTSGMDPSSRRGVWEVLQSLKKGRAIVLCTHFMDEADLLGDRIGIMANGKMAAVGSSLFLKHTFGRGYQLTVRPRYNTSNKDHTITADTTTKKEKKEKIPSPVETAVTTLIPSSALKSSIVRKGKIVQEMYELPLASQTLFPTLLRELERLKVKDLTIGQTTLEEVFLEVGKRLHQKLSGGGEEEKLSDEESTAEKTALDVDASQAAPLPLRYTSTNGSFSSRLLNRLLKEERKSVGACCASSCPRWIRRVCSSFMICKTRWTTTVRSPNMVATQMIIPIVMVTLAFGSTSFFQTTPYVIPPPLALRNFSSFSSGGCAVDLTGFQRNPTARKHVLATLSSLGWNDDAPPSSLSSFVREWSTISDMEKNLTAGLLLPFMSEASTNHVLPSCGGLIYQDVMDKDVDTTGHAYFSNGATVLSINSSIVPSSAMFLNVRTNSMLRDLLASSDKHSNMRVETISHPFPYHVPQVIDTASLFLPMFVGMGFLSSGLGGLALVADRESHRRVVLRLRGLPSSSYICGNLLFDVVVLGGPLMLLSVMLIHWFNCVWLMGVRLVGFLLLVLLGTVGTAALGYSSSYLFRDRSMAARIVPAGLPAVTVIPFVVTFVMTDKNLVKQLSTLFCVASSH